MVDERRVLCANASWCRRGLGAGLLVGVQTPENGGDCEQKFGMVLGNAHGFLAKVKLEVMEWTGFDHEGGFERDIAVSGEWGSQHP